MREPSPYFILFMGFVATLAAVVIIFATSGCATKHKDRSAVEDVANERHAEPCGMTLVCTRDGCICVDPRELQRQR